MSPETDPDAGVKAILARVDRADAAEAYRLEGAIDDLLLADDARLDDETRAAVTEEIAAVVASIERDLVAPGDRVGDGPATGGVVPRLLASGLLRNSALMAELIAGVRQRLLAEALRRTIPRSDQSNLLGRLLDCPDEVVAAAAAALLRAENRARRNGVELSEPVLVRLVWWVAAALRDRAPDDPAFERSVAEAATRSIAAATRADHSDAAAARLAAAIDARPAELGELLAGSLADARPILFFAVLARAASLDIAAARAVALDPQGDRLWLLLRALGLDRTMIARIGLMLSEADRWRDVELFADRLDSLVAVDRGAAAAALAPLRLHPEYRTARRALARSGPA